MIVKRFFLALLMVISLFALAAAPAYAESGNQMSVVTGRYNASPGSGPSPEAMAVDAVLVRPLGVAATILGAGLFVVSLPFSALGGNVGQAGSTLVAAPAKMTFYRPLGKFK